MSLLRFRRATAAAAANLETRGGVAVVVAAATTTTWNPANGIAPTAVRPKRASSSSFARFSRTEPRKHRRNALPSSARRTTTVQSPPRFAFGSEAPGVGVGGGVGGKDDPGRRSFSFYNDPPSDRGNAGATATMGSPAYTVYGEETAFALKAIPPEYRVLPSGTVILDASKRGRLLFEWTPTAGGGSGDRRYRWDASARFALTAEEAGSLIGRIDRGDPSVEFSRRIPGDSSPTGRGVDKVLVAKPAETDVGGKADGICLLMDYVDPENRRFGEIPHPLPAGGGGSDEFGNEAVRGPFEIRLMVGEYRVLRSIIESSIPKLVGWSTMLDRSIEQAVAKSVEGGGRQRGGGGGGRYGGGSSPHNYQGGGGDGR